MENIAQLLIYTYSAVILHICTYIKIQPTISGAAPQLVSWSHRPRIFLNTEFGDIVQMNPLPLLATKGFDKLHSSR